nr:hypothetical protein [uncultured Porphyromonas sp.]
MKRVLFPGDFWEIFWLENKKNLGLNFRRFRSKKEKVQPSFSRETSLHPTKERTTSSSSYEEKAARNELRK